MIAYEVAYEKAKELKQEIDNCTEYENGYVFGFSGDDNYIGGGGHVPVVILKEDGKVIPLNQFIAQGTGQEIRTFEINE